MQSFQCAISLNNYPSVYKINHFQITWISSISEWFPEFFAGVVVFLPSSKELSINQLINVHYRYAKHKTEKNISIFYFPPGACHHSVLYSLYDLWNWLFFILPILFTQRIQIDMHLIRSITFYEFGDLSTKVKTAWLASVTYFQYKKMWDVFRQYDKSVFFKKKKTLTSFTPKINNL